MSKQRKLISFDWAIKRILRSKANFEILEGFLSELLKEDIKILEILESESNKDMKDDKSNQVDIKVKNSNDEIVIIEIQYSRELDYLQRMLYATSKVVIEHISQGNAYSKIKKVISINILYFDFGDGDDYIYKGTTNFEGIHTHNKLYLSQIQKDLYKTNEINKIYPEYYLIKVKNFDDKSKDTLDEWINFLKNETISDNPKAKGLLKAKETLDYLNMPDDEKLAYDRREENLRREASIYESTYIAGGIEARKEERLKSEVKIKEEKLKIAKKLFNANVDIETIKLSTGLTDMELEKLTNQ
ncbi:MAG: Rpn family recombination-promoting nuclease/putative transposase [Campylobacteraceae bacterium]|nr:Rpn family recombination-promoting nuclease/putative transposase [Campylobacteraceae bacterium]